MADAQFTNEFKEWGGIVSNADPNDLPLGSFVSMDNIQIRRSGAADVRRGLIRISTRVASDDGISFFRFKRPETDWFVWETSTGKIKAARVGTPTTTFTIGTGYSTFHPVCFAQDRFGTLYGVNGIDRPFRWDGLTAAVEDAGIDAPAITTSTMSATGGASTGTYLICARYLDDDIDYDEFDTGVGNGYPSSFSPTQTIVAVAGQKFVHNVAASSQSRVTKTQVWRTTAGQTNRFYLAATYNTNGVTTQNDTLTDTALAALQGISLLTADGTRSIARRFTPPPNYKPYIAFLQDRAFYAGSVHYTTGTASISNGSATLTGSGTSWVSTLVGRNVYITGATKPYKITAYASATSLTITPTPAENVGPAAYSISPNGDELNKLLFSEVDNASAVPSQNEIILQENTADPDEITGIAPHDTALLIGQKRHLYTLRYFRQPDVDASTNLIARRGLVNNRCWGHLEGTIYLIDTVGPYSLASGVENIGEPIQNKWKDGTVLGTSKWWHVHADPAQEHVRFFLQYTGDSTTRPSRWEEFNARLGKWTTGQILNEIGGACVAEVNGRQLSYYIGLNDTILQAEYGTADVVTTAITGTATSSSGTSLVDSGAAFTDAVLDAPLAITAGTGKGQIRRITARTGTTLTVSTWTTNPDTTSKYAVGGIQWSMKTGVMEAGGRGSDSEYYAAQAAVLTFYPTTNDATIGIKHYSSQSATADAFTSDQILGDYLTITSGESEAVLNLKKTASNLSDNCGRITWRFSGHKLDRAVSDYFDQFEFGGIQALDQITINDITLMSVE